VSLVPQLLRQLSLSTLMALTCARTAVACHTPKAGAVRLFAREPRHFARETRHLARETRQFGRDLGRESPSRQLGRESPKAAPVTRWKGRRCWDKTVINLRIALLPALTHTHTHTHTHTNTDTHRKWARVRQGRRQGRPQLLHLTTHSIYR
jgi:hypothetical protein